MTIDRDPFDEVDHMFEEAIYLYVFYCACFFGEIDGYDGVIFEGIQCPQPRGGGGYRAFG